MPLYSEMHAIIYINSQGYHDLKVIDYIQYEGEKKDFSLYSTTHPRAFGFRILFIGRIISFGSSILTVIIMPSLKISSGDQEGPFFSR